MNVCILLKNFSCFYFTFDIFHIRRCYQLCSFSIFLLFFFYARSLIGRQIVRIPLNSLCAFVLFVFLTFLRIFFYSRNANEKRKVYTGCIMCFFRSQLLMAEKKIESVLFVYAKEGKMLFFSRFFFFFLFFICLFIQPVIIDYVVC